MLLLFDELREEWDTWEGFTSMGFAQMSNVAHNTPILG